MITLASLVHFLFICALLLMAVRECGASLRLWVRPPSEKTVRERVSALRLQGIGMLKNRSLRVERDACRIGRLVDNDFQVEAPGILDRHLLIFRDEGEWRATRINPQANPVLNGEPITDQSRALRNGDRIDLIGSANLNSPLSLCVLLK